MNTVTHRPSAGSIQSKLVRRPLRLKAEPSLVFAVESAVDVLPQVNAASKSSNSNMDL
jgi:hypothetical protein